MQSALSPHRQLAVCTGSVQQAESPVCCAPSPSDRQTVRPTTHGRCVSRDELLDMYRRFCKDYPIITIEDPFDQDDWDSVTKLTVEGVCQVLPPPCPAQVTKAAESAAVVLVLCGTKRL